MNTKTKSLKTKSFIMQERSFPLRGFDFKTYSTLLALVGLFIILAIITKGDFVSARNFTNLTRQIAVNGILAVGMTMVILTAGIDLSVGSVVALSGIVAGLLQVKLGLSMWGISGAIISTIAGAATGMLCGAINGGLIAVFRIPPFVITLGMMVIAAGAALIFSGSQAISPMSAEFTTIAKGMLSKGMTITLGGGLAFLWLAGVVSRTRNRTQKWPALVTTLALEIVVLAFPLYAFTTDRGLPYPVAILIILAVVCIWGLKNLPFGRFIYAVGGNEEASELSGISVVKVKWPVYAIMGLLAGLSGVILTARLNSASPTIGTMMELDAIAAVVIGGTSLMGGMGTIGGSVIGAFLIGTLNNGMDLMDINSNYQMVIKGIIIIFAVWSDAKTKKKSA